MNYNDDMDINIDEYDLNNEYSEEELHQMLYREEERYEQCERDYDEARRYALDIEHIGDSYYINIDRMEEMLGNKYNKLGEILEEKREIIDRMRYENSCFMEKIEYEYMTTTKQHEETIKNIYDRINSYE